MFVILIIIIIIIIIILPSLTRIAMLVWTMSTHVTYNVYLWPSTCESKAISAILVLGVVSFHSRCITGCLHGDLHEVQIISIFVRS